MHAFKRLFLLFIASFLILSSFICVKAKSETAENIWNEDIIYNYFESYDVEGGREFYYRIYTFYGLREGTVLLSSDMFNSSNYLLMLDSDGVPFVFSSTQDVAEFSFTCYAPSGKPRYCILKGIDGGAEWDGETWNILQNITSYRFSYVINASNIISYNGANITFNGVNYNDINENKFSLVRPDLHLTDYFRLYLNDYISNSGEGFNNNVEYLKLSVINFETKEVLTTISNVLDTYIILRDSENNAYIDIPISKFPYINTVSCKYMLHFNLYLKRTTSYENTGAYLSEFLYNPDDYFMYEYSAESKSGVITAIDKDGNIRKPQEIPDNPPEKDPTEEAIKEQTEVSKNIFQQIIELPGKLVEMFLDMLKSIFIPSDDFLSTYFSDLYDWFCERLGFLSYPVQLFVNILNRILNINFSEPIINIPDIPEPFTGEKLVSATSFNFNSLLTNDTLKNVHDIYLILVDAVIIFALVNLAKNKFEEVTKS